MSIHDFVDNPTDGAHNRRRDSNAVPSNPRLFNLSSASHPRLSGVLAVSMDLPQDLLPHRSQQIAQHLRNDILSGRMAEGVRLTEAELAQRFGVGRSLVREVVQQLSMQGLLITRPNRGAAVAPEAPREIRQLTIPIRRTIEAYALRSVFDDLTETDFQRWQDIINKMQKACEQGDLHAVAEMDIAFHRTLLERAGQPDLLVIWDTLVGRIRSHFRRMQRRYGNILEIVEEHQSLLNAFRNGPLPLAVRLLKANIE